MVDPLTLARVLGGVLLLLGNAFFVTTEFALTRVRQFDREEFAETRGLRRAWEMTEELEIHLSGCQIGITICSVGLGVVAEPAVARLFHPFVGLFGVGTGSMHALSALFALAVINLLHVILGEQTPTYLGIERTKTIAHYLAPPLYWWSRAMAPVIYLADRTAKAILRLGGVPITRSWTEDEGTEDRSSVGDLQAEIGEVLRYGTLSEDRQEEVLRALEIEERPVEEIMIPRERIVALSTEATLATNLSRMRESPFDRFSLFGETWSDVGGVVYVTEVFRQLDRLEAGDLALPDIASPPLTVPVGTAISDLIDRFQDRKQELALVVDGDEAVGLVTTTDAFEAIAGDLEDPLDAMER